VLPRLHPTIRALTCQRIRSKPSAGGPSKEPLGDAQSIPENRAALTDNGSRQIGWAKANAIAAKGDVGEDNSAGGVIGINGNPHPDTAGRALLTQPVDEDGWGWRGLAWAGAGDLRTGEANTLGSEAHPEAAPLGRWGLLLSCFGMLMMLPISEPNYQVLVPLQRIQFPWRWLGPTWFGALLWLSSPGALPLGSHQPRSVLRRGAWLGAITLAAVLWVDSLSRFRDNILGHHPSELERRSLNRLLACDPLVPCPDGVDALPPTGELRLPGG